MSGGSEQLILLSMLSTGGVHIMVMSSLSI